MNKHPYGLYLDSKIIGTALQIVSFYQNNIFDRAETIVYIKKYKITAKKYLKIFSDAGISFRFMRPSELDKLSDQIIFYPFNAQSNCRFVANRKLKHVFITHGESNKIASVKPIIRIYDYVVMAGDLSIERYVKSGLFTQHDADIGRLIKMGDTFIGRTGFSSSEYVEKVICYAPTWEGGLETENYSSLGCDLVSGVLIKAAKDNNINTLIIKPHPNTGHRQNCYLHHLYQIARSISKAGLQVFLYAEKTLFTLYSRLKIKHLGIKWLSTVSKYRPAVAFVDISAMETQFLNEHIPYRVFYKQDTLMSFISKDYINSYLQIGISLDNNLLDSHSTYECQNNDLIDKVIDYSAPSLRKCLPLARLNWLAEFVKKE